MTNYICITCGTQYPLAEEAPPSCPICEDERQYVREDGQAWTTLEAIQTAHHNQFDEEEPNLLSIRTEPRFAIGQRALLVQTPTQNMLWDSISLLDDETVGQVNARGGIDVIAVSHPHFHSSMIEWSYAFDAPIYIHEDNREWIMRSDGNIKFWSGETLQLSESLTLIRCGGHFEGAQILHWASGADGKGALLTADILNVVSDRRYVSFMYSFPNLIPLSPSSVTRIIKAVAPFDYDRIYGGWLGSVVPHKAQAGVAYSAKRYIEAIRDHAS